jgi:hypothetical protein
VAEVSKNRLFLSSYFLNLNLGEPLRCATALRLLLARVGLSAPSPSRLTASPFRRFGGSATIPLAKNAYTYAPKTKSKIMKKAKVQTLFKPFLLNSCFISVFLGVFISKFGRLAFAPTGRNIYRNTWQ